MQSFLSVDACHESNGTAHSTSSGGGLTPEEQEWRFQNSLNKPPDADFHILHKGDIQTGVAMIVNRSAPPATVIPVLIYDDVGAAIEWLCDTFGFTERLRAGNGHAQLVVGKGAVMLGARRRPQTWPVIAGRFLSRSPT